ncbi:MAG: hypothetical protein WBE34_18565, partial [Candidatus Nitrosopolaris sp.]
ITRTIVRMIYLCSETRCKKVFYSVNLLLHLSLSYFAKPTLLLGSERMGKVGYILAFNNEGEVEDVAQSSSRVVTKRTKKGQLLSDIFSDTNGFLIDFVRDFITAIRLQTDFVICKQS